MKLFGCLDINVLENMYEATYLSLLNEIRNDPEFKASDSSKTSGSPKFLG